MLNRVRHDGGVTSERSRSPVPWAVSALVLFGATLAMRFPGVAMYDSVAQYGQALDGVYTDWHPPIMARSWALLNHVGRGTAPFFVIQMLLWWGGLGLLSAALGRRRKHGAAALVLLVGIAPLWLGWATVVLKDAQMACCLVGAAGLAAHWRLAGRPVPPPAMAAIALLIGYATLVRGNAAFATVPFALALSGWPGLAGAWRKCAGTAALIVAVLALGPSISRHVFGAGASGIEKAAPLYDLAGIAHHARLATMPGVAPADWAEAEKRGCYTPYFWNPYGQESQCGLVGDRAMVEGGTGGHIMSRWLGQVVRHPLAYAAHRLRHANANLRFWVGYGEPDAVPPLRSEPNEYGLGAPPTPGGRMLVVAAAAMAASPLGWPAAWLAVAVGLLWAAPHRADPAAQLGRALALSAACMSASFAVVSIASDLRYHLWSMVAAALALILLIDARAIDRRRAFIAAGAVLAVIAIGTVARNGMAPQVYVPLPHAPPPITTARLGADRAAGRSGVNGEARWLKRLISTNRSATTSKMRST